MVINYRLAWVLSHFGFWMKPEGSPVYIWRNRVNIKNLFRIYPVISGSYLSYGKYPENVRGCYRLDLSAFKQKSNWRIVNPSKFCNNCDH